MLLEHIGRPGAAKQVRQAVTATLADGIMTPDLGGTATTELVTNAVIEFLALHFAESRKRQPAQLKLSEFFRDSPLVDAELDLRHDKSLPREDIDL